MAQNPSGTDYMPIGQNAPGHRQTDGGHHTHNFGTGGASTGHHHWLNVAAKITGHHHNGTNAAHAHGVTVDVAGAVNATAAHENRPP